MIKKLSKFSSWIRHRVHSLTLGIVLGTGALILGQSCAPTGQ